MNAMQEEGIPRFDPIQLPPPIPSPSEKRNRKPGSKANVLASPQTRRKAHHAHVMKFW